MRREWGIRLTAKIFRLASREQALVGLRLKCEPTFAMQNLFSLGLPPPTHKYAIRKEDVLAYMENSTREKRKEIPDKAFKNTQKSEWHKHIVLMFVDIEVD